MGGVDRLKQSISFPAGEQKGKKNNKATVRNCSSEYLGHGSVKITYSGVNQRKVINNLSRI